MCVTDLLRFLLRLSISSWSRSFCARRPASAGVRTGANGGDDADDEDVDEPYLLQGFPL